MSILNPPSPVLRRSASVLFAADAANGATADVTTTGWSSLIVSTQGTQGSTVLITVESLATNEGGAVRRPMVNITDLTTGLRVERISRSGSEYRVDVSGRQSVRLTLVQGNANVVTGVLSSEPVIPTPGARVAFHEFLREGTGTLTPLTGWNGLQYEAAILIIDAIDGYAPNGTPEVKYHPSDDWRSIPLYRMDGSMYSPSGFRAAGRYLLDLRGAVQLRIPGTGGTDGWRARLTLHDKMPFNLSSGTDTGVQRFRRISAEDSNVTGDFFAIFALTDTILHSATLFQARQGESVADRNAGLLDTDELPAFQTIFGPFGRIRVSSGTVLAYYR
jgi:hypothetical protein